jgi:hypothetical protein
MKTNRAWHEANRMPERATRAQRIKWHAAHAQACQCRPVPASLRADVEHHLAARPGAKGKPVRTKPAAHSEP